MGEIASHAKGTAKQVATALKGQTGIYTTLSKEHGEASSLMNQAIKASKEQERRPIIEKLRVELLSHSVAEEQTLYARLGTIDETREKAAHGKIEHDEIEEMLKAVFGAPSQSEQQTAALEKLKEHVEHHVKEEERELFGIANRVLSAEEETQLDGDFRRLKEAEKNRLMRDGQGLHH